MVTDAEITRAASALAAGELVVFPTETVYGIGCDATNAAALARLCATKNRPAEKGIAVVLGSAEMVEAITTDVNVEARALMAALWPGPVTVLLPSRSDLAEQIVRDGRTGCRVSGDAVARRLSRVLGRPVASPSANPSDRKPANTADEARAYFGDAVAVYLDDGPRHGTPSTLVDPGPPLRVLREGPVSEAALRAALASR